MCVCKEMKRVVRLEEYLKHVNGTISELIFEFHSGTCGLLRSWVSMLMGWERVLTVHCMISRDKNFSLSKASSYFGSL